VNRLLATVRETLVFERLTSVGRVKIKVQVNIIFILMIQRQDAVMRRIWGEPMRSFLTKNYIFASAYFLMALGAIKNILYFYFCGNTGEFNFGIDLGWGAIFIIGWAMYVLGSELRKLSDRVSKIERN
jgi:hypothetical protein